MPSKNDFEHLSDLGNAKRLVARHGCKIRYVKEWGWLIWTGTHWALDNKGAIGLYAKDTVGSIYREVGKCEDSDDRKALAKFALQSESKGSITAMIVLAENEPGIRVSAEDFDNDPDKLNVANGVIDLRTGQLIPHSSEQHFTYCIKVPYEPQADRTEWISFLEQVVDGGEEMIEYVQTAIGYTLTGHTNEEVLFYIWGPTRSGKGTFTETLFHLLGKPLATETDFSSFTAKRDQDASNFDLADLKPARAVFASEGNRYQTLNTGKIKALTGGNRIRCCFKHKDFFEYRPQFKMWLSNNWELNADVDDDAMWYRARIIHFPNRHDGDEDKGLKARMRNPETLKGILAWAVEGSVRWYGLPKGLPMPDQVKENNLKHRQIADFVQNWLDECSDRDENVIADSSTWTPNNEVMSSFTRWCKENNIEPKSAKALATSLRAKGYFPATIAKVGGVTMRGVQGLKLLN